MVRTINISADIPTDREMKIKLPADVPTGPTDVVVVLGPRPERPYGRSVNWRNQSFSECGAKDDIGDSAEFARKLRLND